MQQWSQIQVMGDSGMTVAAIARKLGMDRETAGRWLGRRPPERIKRGRAKKLDQFRN